MVGSEHAYALVADWLEPRRRRSIARARAGASWRAATSQGHAPADDRDLARWSGLALRDARAGLRAIASELRERPDGLLELERARRRAAAEPAPPRLLGAFDPLLLGWCSREPIVGAEQVAGHRQRAVPAVRARARTRGGELEDRRARGRARAVRAPRARRRGGAARRRRGRAALPGAAPARRVAYAAPSAASRLASPSTSASVKPS